MNTMPILPLPVITLDQQIASVKREIAMRQRVYPGWVDRRRMSQQKADEEISAMQAVLATLESLKRDAKRPDPLGEALNSGDGSYRP